jgi:hypothetical protein
MGCSRGAGLLVLSGLEELEMARGEGESAPEPERGDRRGRLARLPGEPAGELEEEAGWDV